MFFFRRAGLRPAGHDFFRRAGPRPAGHDFFSQEVRSSLQRVRKFRMRKIMPARKNSFLTSDALSQAQVQSQWCDEKLTFHVAEDTVRTG